MTDDPWALCHLDDSFDASVLGTKGAQIQWFEDRESLIEFLLEDFGDLLADVGELDEDQTESARERFTLLVEQSQDDRTLMDAINDLASGHEYHPIRHFSSEGDFMCDDDHGHATCGQVAHDIQNIGNQFGVEGAGRFIE